MPPPSVAISVQVTIPPRLIKRLDNWQGAPLVKRTDKSIQAGLKLYGAALRMRAMAHNQTGKTSRGYAVRKLRKRPGEVAAYKVGSNTWYKHFALKADPYVDQVREQLEQPVTAFISEQIRRLA